LNTRVDQSRNQSSAGDVAKYVVAALLVVAGLVAFYWFEGRWVMPLRVLAVIAGVASGLIVFLVSAKGLQARTFFQDARIELRKVVWPTRQEAVRMTWVVMVVVVIISLLLAGFDMVIQWAIRLLLGN
jgi:preprotein translocase subunit SecE